MIRAQNTWTPSDSPTPSSKKKVTCGTVLSIVKSSTDQVTMMMMTTNLTADLDSINSDQDNRSPSRKNGTLSQKENAKNPKLKNQDPPTEAPTITTRTTATPTLKSACNAFSRKIRENENDLPLTFLYSPPFHTSIET